MNFNNNDKIDIQSDDSAASADSGVIFNDRLMPNSNRCNIDISTSVECDNSNTTTAKNATINIENIINFAKNVSPTKNCNKKGSPKRDTHSNGSSSAASSLRSTRISITSIHSDASSSVIDSDCEVDDFDESATNGNFTITKLGHQTTCMPGASGGGISPSIGNNEGLVLFKQSIEMDHNMDVMGIASSSSINPSNTQMSFTNSSDITFGQKNYYQGPVTIQQFLIENRNREAACLQGSENPGFENDCPSSGVGKPYDNQKDCQDEKTSSKRPNKFIFNRRAILITIIIVIITILIGFIFATSSLMIKQSSKQDEDDEESRKHIPVDSTIGNDNIGAGSVLRLIVRDEWLARPSSEELTKLNLPVHRVIIAHTATEKCTTQAACVSQTQRIQQFHMDSKEFGDIGYNFLVGGDGAIYEGRGWEFQGAHTLGFNVDSICIAFIGTFTKMSPSEGQLKAAKLIIEEGVRLNKLVPDYRLYGMRQFIATESPGIVLYSIIKKWPHWSDKPV